MGEKLTKVAPPPRTSFQAHTQQVVRAGFVCASCGQADQLYSDLHGTFCDRCGPSYPLRRVETIPTPGLAALSEKDTNHG